MRNIIHLILSFLCNDIPKLCSYLCFSVDFENSVAFTYPFGRKMWLNFFFFCTVLSNTISKIWRLQFSPNMKVNVKHLKTIHSVEGSRHDTLPQKSGTSQDSFLYHSKLFLLWKNFVNVPEMTTRSVLRILPERTHKSIPLKGRKRHRLLHKMHAMHEIYLNAGINDSSDLLSTLNSPIFDRKFQHHYYPTQITIWNGCSSLFTLASDIHNDPEHRTRNFPVEKMAV